MPSCHFWDACCCYVYLTCVTAKRNAPSSGARLLRPRPAAVHSPPPPPASQRYSVSRTCYHTVVWSFSKVLRAGNRKLYRSRGAFLLWLLVVFSKVILHHIQGIWRCIPRIIYLLSVCVSYVYKFWHVGQTHTYIRIWYQVPGIV